MVGNHWNGTINQNQFGHQGKCAINENECFIWTSCHIIDDWASKGIQKKIYMDIQRLEKYPTKDCST